MLRTVDVVMIGILLGGAAFTFKVKQDSEAAIERVAELERQIAAEREAIDILEADWSLLSDPKRLQKLAERYEAQLGLKLLDPGMIGDFADIPERPPFLPRKGDDTEIADLIGESDDIVTGSTVSAPLETEAGQ